jgi:hypothetical protein
MEMPFRKCSSNSFTHLKKNLRGKKRQRGGNTDKENKTLLNQTINIIREMIKGEEIPNRTIITATDLIHLSS